MAPIIKASIFTFFATIFIFGCYEWYLRSHNYIISYDDEGGALFADIRRNIYMPMDKATVMLGSSRMKFDLDIDTWKTKTGETAVQLANVGSAPLSILQDLANDKKFSGKVIIDVTEGPFFDFSGRSNRRPKEKLEYYQKETIAQRWSFHINTILESCLVFLDKENFSLSSWLKRCPMPKREGKNDLPPYPIDFGRVTRERQELMASNFVNDTAQINFLSRIWIETSSNRKNYTTMPQKKIDSLCTLYLTSIQKIKSRNGKVIFIRPPSCGKILELETTFFPREKYWDRLLKLTETAGIHFQDYNSLKDFSCVELSHLSVQDAVKFTTSLINILKDEGFIQ